MVFAWTDYYNNAVMSCNKLDFVDIDKMDKDAVDNIGFVDKYYCIVDKDFC